jgi:thymidylate synthase ThyX
MAYKCEILADSVNSATGDRLTTFAITYPRFVHSELMTHRAFSRNSASSRAIPVAKMIENIKLDPVFPVFWGKNQKGMQAAEEMSAEEIEIAKKIWLEARDNAIESVNKLIGNTPVYENGQTYKNRFSLRHLTTGEHVGNFNDLEEVHSAKERVLFGMSEADKELNYPLLSVEELNKYELDTHKQIANRLLEPWMWITVIVSATSYGNFFNLRCHKDAQPEIKVIAEMMRDAYYNSTPRQLAVGEWHLPLLQPEDEGVEEDKLVKVCVGRVARVSYLTHDGKRDLEADVTLHDRLLSAGHMSPFEHVAKASETSDWFGNFKGFEQYRKTVPNENRELYEWEANCEV